MKNKKGFIISTTLYSIFGIMAITVFYILYILVTNRTIVSATTEEAKTCLEKTIVVNESSNKKYWEYHYTGDYQEFVATYGGTYKFELYGANSRITSIMTTYKSTPAYVKGEIDLVAGQKLYVYVGESPNDGSASYNGGGKGFNLTAHNDMLSFVFGGGGATDIRTTPGPWYMNLDTRIIVAGGAGSSGSDSGNDYKEPGSASYIDSDCKLIINNGQGPNGLNAPSAGLSEPSCRNFKGYDNTNKGYGNNSLVIDTGNDLYSTGPGGGGYYGGCCGEYSSTNVAAGGGGSSYISTNTWCPGLLSHLAVSGYNFTNIIMGGEGTNFPDAFTGDDTQIHYGNGIVKITYCENGIC